MNEPAYNLSGRSAIITGASQGLGRTIAAHFVRAGANVFLTARDQVMLEAARDRLQAIAAPNQQVLIQCADVSDRQSCKDVVAIASAQLPNLSILVNNAGVHGPIGPLEEMDWDQWIKAIEINLFGTAMMCREVIPIVKQRHYGKIINLSGGGATAPMPRFSAYAASKAAIVRLTETLAQELQDWSIDVNAIAPGALNTRLLDDVLSAGPERVGDSYYQRALRQQEQGGASPDQAAALAVLLASAAGDGISGRLISAVWDDWKSLPDSKEKLAGTDIYTLRRIIPADRENKS